MVLTVRPLIMSTRQNIAYRTPAPRDVARSLVLVLSLLLGSPVLAAPKPVWWPAAKKAAQEAWDRSLACDCEQSFAVVLAGENIVIRVFKPVRVFDRNASGYTVTPDTVAVFHTHLHDALP